ncbi:MAG: isoprenylcysteine carboxylmethyltransferase family protein [Ignavibacteriales bacterium]|nr:MAG: isoprenylcysteine carboxylmethyltransferase family protein [Ignavibacteriales bacterium]
MDPINILIGINIIASFGANVAGAKKGLKSSVIAVKERPVTYLQKLPLVLSTITLVALILAVFQVGTLEYKEEYFSLRITGLIIYIIFSWIQISAYKSLGENYSQEILIFKNHSLVQKGMFRIIRHPQYLSQILLDIGGALATLSFIVAPVALLQIPFIVMRASMEEKLLEKYFKNEFTEYKKKSGFMIPFL